MKAMGNVPLIRRLDMCGSRARNEKGGGEWRHFGVCELVGGFLKLLLIRDL